MADFPVPGAIAFHSSPHLRARTAIDATASHTAVLFFSHRPEREWQNKWFVRQDYAKNRQVAEAFYQHTRQAAAESGFPVLEINSDQQRGNGFGTRLANAFADAFAQGHDRVIAVGNDCPRLHEVDWEKVAGRLDEGRPVLGPTPDRDGTYLIGMTRAQFDRGAFAALPWQSSALFSALARYLADQSGTAPAQLPPRDDVNGPGDLATLIRRRTQRAFGGLLTVLRRVLGPTDHVFRSRDPVSNARLRGPRSRAPPVLSSAE